MSIGHSPIGVHTGLVLAIDPSNTGRSFRGQPTTNILYTNGVIDFSIGSLVASVTQSTVVLNHVYRITSTTGGAFRIYVPLAGLTNGLTYTMSFKYRVVGGAGGFSMTDWCDTALSNVVNTDYGTYQYSAASGTRATYDATFRFMDCNIAADSVIEIWDIQVEQRTYATPFINGIRTTSQVMYDLTSTNPITANSLTYASDNTVSFNGTSDFMNATYAKTDLNGDPLFTVCAFIKRTASFNSGGYWGMGADVLLEGINGYTSVADKIGIDLWGTATFHTGVDYPLNQWVHVAWVKHAPLFNVNTVTVYINGTAYTGGAFTVVRGTSHTPALNTSTKGITVGGLSPIAGLYYAPGYVDKFSVYNRVLSATEITQNLNAHRGRYGI